MVVVNQKIPSFVTIIGKQKKVFSSIVVIGNDKKRLLPKPIKLSYQFFYRNISHFVVL